MTTTETPEVDGFERGFRSADGRTETWNRGGIEWHKAPLPRRLHRCSPQTKGYVNYFEMVERCACGAVRLRGGRWMDRNQRQRAGGST